MNRSYNRIDAIKQIGREIGADDHAPALLYTYLGEFLDSWAEASGNSEIAAVAEAYTVLDRIQRIQVSTARRTGRSWGQIAHELGITRQAAQQKFGAKKEPAKNQLTGQKTIEEAL